MFDWPGVSSTTSLPRIRRRKKSEKKERRKSVSPGSHPAITEGGVYSQKDVRPEEASQV